jgi:hypothetical protein
MEFDESCRIIRTAVAIEDRTARLTILIDPRKKALFERLCVEEDATPSQVLRRLIRSHIKERTGQPWTPPVEEPEPVARGATRRLGRT